MKARVIVIGSTGMLGQALTKAIVKQPKRGPIHAIVAAGLVGGITDNMARPVNYLRANLKIALSFLDKCQGEPKIKRLVYVGSSCMYPRNCRQPMHETDLWTGPLEPTNEGYAVAKLAGEALCRAYRQQYGVDFRTAILCNLYGPLDRGLKDASKAHVVPALIRKFTDAKAKGLRVVRLMGNGTAYRELMHHDDAARGILAYLSESKAPPTVNIGSGEQVSIAHLAGAIAELCGYKGRIVFAGGEDGMPRKHLDSGRIRKMGWKPTIKLADGLMETVKAYQVGA
jgi:GDP-L-fucose synthase